MQDAGLSGPSPEPSLTHGDPDPGVDPGVDRGSRQPLAPQNSYSANLRLRLTANTGTLAVHATTISNTSDSLSHAARAMDLLLKASLGAGISLSCSAAVQLFRRSHSHPTATVQGSGSGSSTEARAEAWLQRHSLVYAHPRLNAQHRLVVLCHKEGGRRVTVDLLSGTCSFQETVTPSSGAQSWYVESNTDCAGEARANPFPPPPTPCGIPRGPSCGLHLPGHNIH